jgi:hypothetical protein
VKKIGGNITATNTIRVERVRGTPEALTITHTNLPEGIKNPSTIPPCTPPCTILNTISVSDIAESGKHSLTLRAKGKTIERIASYDLFVGYTNVFGMHLKGSGLSFTREKNPDTTLTMDYPFDLLLDGGTPSTITFGTTTPNASTSITFIPPTCSLPCKNMTARVHMLHGMKAGNYSITLKATTERNEVDTKGTPKTVKYSDSLPISVKIQ